MKITSIKRQVKNSERASVFIDNRYSFSLSLGELVKERLRLGQELDEPDLSRLKKISNDGKLRARAMEWVMNRPRSIREFRNYMYRKQAGNDLAQRLEQEFTDRGYLDEYRFSAWLVDLRRRKGKSERAIRAELSQKGVARDITDQSLGDGDDEVSRLSLLVAKKQNLLSYRADPQKLIAYFARQGFSYEDIKAALKEAKLQE